MPRLRWWLVDLPNRVVDVWFVIFRYYLFVVTLVASVTSMAMVVLTLLLYLFGIRWGW